MQTCANLIAAPLAVVALIAAGGAYGQISFRGAASATAQGITPTFRAAASAASRAGNLSINKPSGVGAGDVLIASVAVRPSSAVITPPAGWTLVRRLANPGSSSNSLAVFHKVALTVEPASYVWDVPGASFSVGGIQAFSGIDTANPIDAENGQNTPLGTIHAAPSITTSIANAMLVSAHAFASSETWDPPGGMTESADRRSEGGPGGISIEVNRALQSVAGSTGSKAATADGKADVGNAHLLALRPAGANLSIATPAGTVPGDVMVAAIAFNHSSAFATPPAGWTIVRRMNNAAQTSNVLAIYRRTAAPGEPATHVWRIAGGTFIVGGIQSFSRVDAANPIDAESGHSTPSSTSHDTPSITTGSANAMLVTAHSYAAAQSWTAEAALTEAFDRAIGLGGIGQSITGTYQLQATAASTGAKRSTAAASSDVGNAHILALRPANAAPIVSLTSPAHGSTFNAAASIPITANASDQDGTIQRVDFYHGGTNLIGTATSAPYTFSWIPAIPGSYSITAVATDNQNVTTTSAPVNVTVLNTAPTISITSPVAGANFTAPANIVISATALDAEGGIQKVEFFHGGTNLIVSLTAAPYSITWTGVPAGAYSLTVVATDSHNASTISAPVTVTVNREATLHFAHVDHLNTPRLVADALGTTVWEWSQREPFGNDSPTENLRGLGTFEMPLRMPGQYHDKETSLFYNYFRNFDPALGRYVESDPIGLLAGVNTYAYVGGNPLSSTDPLGLKAYQCRKPLDALGGTGTRSGPDIWGNPAYHQYSCVIDANGQVTCGGQDRSGAGLGIPGTPWKGSEGRASNDKYDANRCEPTYDNKCFDDCLKEEWKKPRPRYGIPWGIDCQDYDDDVNSRCRKKCGLK